MQTTLLPKISLQFCTDHPLYSILSRVVLLTTYDLTAFFIDFKRVLPAAQICQKTRSFTILQTNHISTYKNVFTQKPQFFDSHKCVLNRKGQKSKICHFLTEAIEYRLAIVDDVKVSRYVNVRSATVPYTSVRTSLQGKEIQQAMQVHRSVKYFQQKNNHQRLQLMSMSFMFSVSKE